MGELPLLHPALRSMTRRLAFAALAASVFVAVGVVALLLLRDSPDAPRVSTEGTLEPTTVAAGSRTAGAIPAGSPSTTSSPVVTYPIATTVPPPRPPASLAIGAIGVSADVVGIGLEPGTNELEVPDIEHVGWYELGANPGDAGSAVLVGHVDGDGREGVFFRLGELAPGDLITVRDATGARDFRVTGREEVPKPALSAELFSRAGPPRLVLITCGGAFDDATGHYLDNIVVVATPA